MTRQELCSLIGESPDGLALNPSNASKQDVDTILALVEAGAVVTCHNSRYWLTTKGQGIATGQDPRRVS